MPAAKAVAVVQHFTESAQLIDRWMQCKLCNRLKFNTDKTQLIWMETRKQLLLKVNISGLNIQGYPIRFSSNVSDLGELLDDQLKMLGHSLTVDAKKTLVNAFVASCLDFCNSLYHGIGDQRSTGQIWVSSDCGGQTRTLGNTTIYL